MSGAAAGGAAAGHAGADNLVRTAEGPVVGVAGDGLVTFTGIPYAEPPVGPTGRFRPPRRHEGWSAVRPATTFAPAARQLPSPLDALLGATPEANDEACLALNVWTPGCDPDARRPVLVWIHGGAFVQGSGSLPVYHGDRIARRGDVVVVTINYRLGEFGWLHLDALGPEFAGSGNCGLLDQIEALRWVQRNIAGFGGDPGNVTIFGESAGAMSVAALLGAPAARGLFHRAIAQSGAANAFLTAEQAAETAEEYRRRAGVGDLADLVDLPADRLLAVQAELAAETFADLDAALASGRPGGLRHLPVVDGVVLDRPPLEAVRAGSAADVALLTGTTAEEYQLFLVMDQRVPDDDALAAFAARTLGHRLAGEEIVAAYRADHPGASNRNIRSALLTDLIFRIPMVQLVEAQARHRDDTRVYRFDWRTPAFGGALGACHAIDLPFTFGTLDLGAMAFFLGPEPPAVLATTTMDAWTAFARTGDPSTTGQVWPAYDPAGDRATLLLDTVTSIASDPNGRTRRLWEDT